MKWPLKPKAVSPADTPFFNQHYLYASGSGTPDSTIVWTSEFPWQNVQQYIQHYKQKHSRFISTSHVLVQAIGQALAAHPEMNRRVVGRKVYEFKSCNVCLGTRVPGCNEVFVIQVHDVDQRPLYQIAYIIMMKQLEYARENSRSRRDLARFRKFPSWFSRWSMRVGDWMDRNFVVPVTGRIDRLRESGVFVNDFSSNRFPVMRSYKPSRQPGENKPISVTIGRAEEKVVWKNGAATVQQVAPITIRVDHRICDGFQLAQFVNTVVTKLTRPAEMEPAAAPIDQTKLDNHSNLVEKRRIA